MKLSSIFDPEPPRWGFRGDPVFWRYLKKRYGGVSLPVDPRKLEALIREEHKRLSGEVLCDGSMAVVRQFEQGGMTSGGISGTFWENVGIPLLKERLEAANSKLRGTAKDQ